VDEEELGFLGIGEESGDGGTDLGAPGGFRGEEELLGVHTSYDDASGGVETGVHACVVLDVFGGGVVPLDELVYVSCFLELSLRIKFSPSGYG
jgi:hypothetical protein